MKLWLTKCHGGRYCLTKRPPVLHKIDGTKHIDAFDQPGEPVSVRHLCEPIVQMILGRTLEPLTPTKIEIAARVLEPVDTSRLDKCQPTGLQSPAKFRLAHS